MNEEEKQNIDVVESGTRQSGPSESENKWTTNDESTRTIRNENNRDPSIFKLDVDCFEEVFDYLSLKELVAVGQTCKRLHRVAGYYFNQNYATATVCCDKKLFIGNLIVNYFVDFIEKLWINNNNLDNDDEDDESYDDNKANPNFIERIPFNNVTKFHQTELYTYKSLNLIEMAASGLSRQQFEGVKRLLNKVECINVWPESLPLDDGFYESFLRYCTNLKSLSIVLVSTDLVENQDDWLYRRYPKLEYFELRMLNIQKIDAMKNFLQLNPNIHTLAIYGRILWINRESYMNIGHKLKVLATTYVENYLNAVELSLFCILLNELHERGFHSRLHLYFPGACFKQSHANELVSLKGLVKISIVNPHEHIKLAPLTGLEELFIGKSNVIADLNDLPSTLVNLKRIQFLTASLNDILVFIKRAKKLNKIKVNFLRNGTGDECIDTIDLFMLNREREKLAGANKITIYVRDRIYLVSKWVMKQTDYKFIEMKRATSYHWQHEFEDASNEK